MKLSKLYFSGLSGLQLRVPKLQYPPPYQEASRMTYYASIFNSIEINSSFYKLPMQATVAKWAASVPENFKFTFKLWKEITHTKDLNFNKSDIEKFMSSINRIQHKKGCLLIQFPPSLGKETIHQLESLLECIRENPENNEWKVAIEFRNNSWYDDNVYDLTNSYNATVVIQDIPKSATPMHTMESDTVYIRFHGPTGNYRDSYSEDFLNEYAHYIHEWIQDGKMVFVYFNNTMGDAYSNLETLNKLMLQNFDFNIEINHDVS